MAGRLAVPAMASVAAMSVFRVFGCGVTNVGAIRRASCPTGIGLRAR
jgi:hypothetical protein